MWKTSIHTWEMAQRLQIQRIFVTHRGGRGSKLSNMTRLLWRTIHTSLQDLKEFKIQNFRYSDWIKTTKSTTCSKRRMHKNVVRTCGKASTRIQANSSWSTVTTAKRRSIRRNRRARLSSRPSNQLTVLLFRVTGRTRSIRQQIGILTVGRREVGIIGILRGLTIRDFLRV